MAPDRGLPSLEVKAIDAGGQGENISEEAIEHNVDNGDNERAILLEDRHEAQEFLAEQADQGQNFTVRGVLVGLVIGVIICFSNTYFGLQTGWVSGMAMPAALIGFAWFKSIARWINYPFTPVENVLVQTVAGAVGTMPLGCGFVGVMPALNCLLRKDENGPLVLGTGKLVIWALGICFFGVAFAVPLRREVIIREKLKFPSGTATALVIGVLHGNPNGAKLTKVESGLQTFRRRSQDLMRSTSSLPRASFQAEGSQQPVTADLAASGMEEEIDHRDDWKSKIKLLIYAFSISAVYVRLVVQQQDIVILANPLRRLHRISFLSFITFLSLASLWRTTGYGV